MSELIEDLRKIVAEVQHTERTNTRNAGTDFRARCFFADHGQELLARLETRERIAKLEAALSEIVAIGNREPNNIHEQQVARYSAGAIEIANTALGRA